MIHIVGSSGIIGDHLKRIFNRAEAFELQESGKWSFESVSKGDLVYYLRSISSPFITMEDPKASYELNVIKTKKAISEILKNGARVVFASSDVVYGETSELYATEETPINPHGEYANQKALIEMLFRDEPNFMSLRISSVVGEGSKLQKLLTRGERIEIFDPIIRTPIYINDLGTVFSRLIRSDFRLDFPNGVLNVGGHAPMSNLEIATLEARHLGCIPPVPAPRSEFDKSCRPGTVRMNTTKAQEFAKIPLNILRYYE
jgi:nucleoside-diphosphate-sugar epimerase